MRAMSVAIIYLFANLIGMGLGPLAAGVLSDLFRAWAGEESLALCVAVSLLLDICGRHCTSGSRVVRCTRMSGQRSC